MLNKFILINVALMPSILLELQQMTRLITAYNFIHEYGIPKHLAFDGALTQVGTGTLLMQTITRMGIHYHVSALKHLNQNFAEGSIQKLRKGCTGSCLKIIFLVVSGVSVLIGFSRQAVSTFPIPIMPIDFFLKSMT